MMQQDGPVNRAVDNAVYWVVWTSVNRAVNRAVDEAAWGAVTGSVFWDVRVSGAVGVSGAVNGDALVGADHPALQDCLRETDVYEQLGLEGVRVPGRG